MLALSASSSASRACMIRKKPAPHLDSGLGTGSRKRPCSNKEMDHNPGSIQLDHDLGGVAGGLWGFCLGFSNDLIDLPDTPALRPKPDDSKKCDCLEDEASSRPSLLFNHDVFAKAGTGQAF